MIILYYHGSTLHNRVVVDFKTSRTKRTSAGNNSQVVKLSINEEENISQDGLEKSPLEIKESFIIQRSK